MPQIAAFPTSKAWIFSSFALVVDLLGHVIVQTIVNTAIVKSCHDRYDSAIDLSAVPRNSTFGFRYGDYFYNNDSIISTGYL